MKFFSDAIKEYEKPVQRRLYSLFVRAVKAGEVEAARLTDKIQIQGANGKVREVVDFGYPDGDLEKIESWISEQLKPKKVGYDSEELMGLSDDELRALIRAQQKPKRGRKKMSVKSDGIKESNKKLKKPKEGDKSGDENPARNNGGLDNISAVGKLFTPQD